MMEYIGSLAPLPFVVLAAEHDGVDPVVIKSASGILLVAAESRSGERARVLLASSGDNGTTWTEPVTLAEAGEGKRISVGAGACLPSGRLVLAIHEWNETRGEIAWTGEEPRGMHHYAWSGFRRRNTLKVLVSDDEGKTWREAGCRLQGGPIAPGAMGTVFTAEGADWLPVFGPADEREMDGALSSVGLMRSDDSGDTWAFSHWVARADRSKGIAYGPGHVAVLPDGRWLALLEARYRGMGDYARPRISRTVSADGGKTWSAPEAKLLGPSPSVLALDGDRIMAASSAPRGVFYCLSADASETWICQEVIWDCIWYQDGRRGGARLLAIDDDKMLAVYHWMDRENVARTEVRGQFLRRPAFAEAARDADEPEEIADRWVPAEAYQVPDIPAAPAGIRLGTLLRLSGGDWMCIGYTGSKTDLQAAHGFAVTGFCVLRAPRVEGPWRKVAGLPAPDAGGAAHDTGTGAGTPAWMTELSSGRLLLAYRMDGDILLLSSDDEGSTWSSGASLASMLKAPRVTDTGTRPLELEDRSLLLPLARSHSRTDLFHARSRDAGQTWTDIVTVAAQPAEPCHGLPHPSSGVRGEAAIALLDNREWLAVYREERGTPVPADFKFGPLGMPMLYLRRSFDGGRTWSAAQPGFMGVEPDLMTLPGGALVLVCREDCYATCWLSYDRGHTWRLQDDACEMPWRTGAAEAHTQWPPGGEPHVQILDDDTAVLVYETGLSPSGRVLPAGHVMTRELHGRAQVRYLRRVRRKE